MSLIERIVSFFSIKPLSKESGEFKQLDPDKLALELKIKHKAIQRASVDAPDSNSKPLDSIEMSIQNKIKGEIRGLHTKAIDKLNGLKDELQNISLDKDLYKVDSISSEFEEETSTIFTEAKKEIENCSNEIKVKENEINKFKAANNLDRECEHPDEVSFKWAFIILVAVIETIVNGSFFQSGSSLGLLGGILQAAAIAVVNIGAACIVGRLALPYLPHINKTYSGLCKLGLSFYSIILFFFALFLAHYRETYISNPLDVSNIAIDNFLSNPFYLSDPESWIFFGITIIFAIGALYSSYKTVDEYAGYSTVVRAKDRSKYKLIDEVDDVKSRLKDQHENSKKQMNEAELDIEDKKNSLSHNPNSRSALINIFNKQKNEYIDVGRFLIKLYRDTNTENRKTPSPKYFQKEWDIDRSEFELNHESLTLNDFSDQLTEIKDLELRLSEIKDEFHKKYRRLIEEVEDLY